jgi:PAS domain S-box-containing protein
MGEAPFFADKWMMELAQSALVENQHANLTDAEETLKRLGDVFFQSRLGTRAGAMDSALETLHENNSLNVEARYRTLMEQIPAVVFMAYLDKGMGEAYVSPQIEAALGFSQSEWLEDPVRWYQQIHPEDKQRWSAEAAEMFLSGKPLRSAYRVIARDGQTRWFHCEAKMVRREDGRPWFIHGVGVDITELKRAETSLQEERNVLTAILDTAGALILVLNPDGRIVRFNRACERMTGYRFEEVSGKCIWDLFLRPEEVGQFKTLFDRLFENPARTEYESCWVTRDGSERVLNWSAAVLPGAKQTPAYVIISGIDVTERKRLEEAVLEISERERHRIGRDLHDGLGQHLTGIAFMSKVLAERLAEEPAEMVPEAAEAAKIVRLVNDAIRKTKELARGLLPVVSDAEGLTSALRQCAEEMEDLFGVTCSFRCDAGFLMKNVNVATHLYQITREALNNAMKHGNANDLQIVLSSKNGEGTLSISDNGTGLPEVLPSSTGMGLDIMSYRARMVGGSLQLRRNPGGGATVSCIFPMPVSEAGSGE